MTTTVSGTTSKPVTNVLAALPPKPPPLVPTLSFRSLLLGDAAEPPPDAPLLALSSLLPPQTQTPTPLTHEAPPLGKSLPARAAHGCDDDRLDPIHRQHALFGPPDMLSSSGVVATQGAAAPPTAQTTELARAQTSLEDLIPALVRRVQWGGDGRKGTVRMELGAGTLAGGTLQVSAVHGRVSVHLDVPPGVDAADWQKRIQARLAAQNIATDAIEVT